MKNFSTSLIHLFLRSAVFVFFLLFCLIINAEILENLPKTVIDGKEYYIYEAKKGESSYGIAKKFGWDIDELISLNPNSSNSIQSGSVFYYPVNSDLKIEGNKDSENIELIRHKVKKGETIYSIAREYNIPTELIYQNNLSARKGIKKDDYILIPRIRGMVEKKEYVSDSDIIIETQTDLKDNEVAVITFNECNEDVKLQAPNEQENLEDLITEIKERNETFEEKNTDNYDNIFQNESDTIAPIDVKLALILDDPNSNKDIDFTRGLIVGISNFEDVPYKINLKVMDGRTSSQDIIEQLDLFEPNIILSTADKAFPLFLADYGNTNQIKVINVFDLKNDLYEENISIVQLLPPANLFNDNIANRLYNDYGDRRLIIIGDIDINDGLALKLINLFKENSETLSLEEFGSFQPTSYTESFLIYSYANKKEDVADFLTNVETLNDNYPGLDYKIIGRSSWIAMLDDFSEQFGDFSVFVPSRVWQDEESTEWKNFYSKYEELFGGNPVRSIPNFSVSGYDVAMFFIPFIGEYQENLKNIPPNNSFLLQNEYGLNKIGENGGLFNENSYLVKFNRNGTMEKIIVK